MRSLRHVSCFRLSYARSAPLFVKKTAPAVDDVVDCWTGGYDSFPGRRLIATTALIGKKRRKRQVEHDDDALPVHSPTVTVLLEWAGTTI